MAALKRKNAERQERNRKMSKDAGRLNWEVVVPSNNSADKEQKVVWSYVLVVALTGLSGRLN